MKRLGSRVAVIGATLTALSLAGSARVPAESDRNDRLTPSVEASLRESSAHGISQLQAGDFLAAEKTFESTAQAAREHGALRIAVRARSNAGGAAFSRQDYRSALSHFVDASRDAEVLGDADVSAGIANNLATLYLSSGHVQAAAETASKAIGSARQLKDKSLLPKLRVQLAEAEAKSGQIDQAISVYHLAVNELLDVGDTTLAIRVMSMLAYSCIDAKRLDDGESALDEALVLANAAHLVESGNLYLGLARIRGLRGDTKSAERLFELAATTPVPPVTPRWIVFADRGEFRLSTGDFKGAFEDFRKARRIVADLRADMVPADIDRVAMESGLARIPAGLVEAGNQMSLAGGSQALLDDTFEAAEQDRLWSLRALVPDASDWRKRLSPRYWDLLSRYQSIERRYLEKPDEKTLKVADALAMALGQEEAAASGTSQRMQPDGPQVLSSAKRQIGRDSVLLSFLVTARHSWLWVVSNEGTRAFELPNEEALKSATNEFVEALRKGSPNAVSLGAGLYRTLFGQVPASLLNRGRWLLELDGPLFDLPFAALVVGEKAAVPEFLCEKVALEAIPGALLFRGTPRTTTDPGSLLAIGDPIYNTADERFEGQRNRNTALPRLPGTAGEIARCERAWARGKTSSLTGSQASLAGFQTALAAHPSVIHFATHVLPGPDAYSSGMIALSMNRAGEMEMIGPQEIVTHPVDAALVVMNGCHSGQGAALPSAGLMGLTRAWIGAGAGAVLATRWEIPDESGQAFIAAFYDALGRQWERGPAYAVQAADVAMLRDSRVRSNPSSIAAYFLLGRI